MTNSKYENDMNPAAQTFNQCQIAPKSQACDQEMAAYNAYRAEIVKKKTIETDIKQKKKAWYESADKLNKYNEEIGLEAREKAKVITDQWNIEFKSLYDNIENNYHHLSSLEKYCPGAEKLDVKYLSLIKKDNVESEKLIKQANIDQRMAEFYNNNDYYNDLLYYVKWVYWVMFLLCVVMLFMSGQYKNIKTYLFFIVLAAFPTVILNNVITWANTNISQVKLNTLYLIFLIIGSLTVSLLYYSGNMAMPTEVIPQEIK